MPKRGLMLLLALALVAGACGGEPTATEEPTAAEAPTVQPTATEAAAGTVVATADSDLGTILVDGEGLTLYVFDNDTAGESTCYDDCEANWPPLLGEATAEGEADAGLLGTTTREDGSTQVTYDGRPLYYFAGDSAPGDTNGQGVGDIWWVVAPDGNAIETAADAAVRY